MTRVVSVDGVRLGAHFEVDANGCQWILTRLHGWDAGGAEVRRAVEVRPSGHGIFAQRGWRGARLIGMQGDVLCPSRAAAAQVMTTLSTLLADGGYGELRVDDDDFPTLTARVGLADDPSVIWIGPTRVRYGLDFIAPDPLRYGDWITATTPFPEPTGGLEYDLYTNGAGVDLGYLDYGAAAASGVATVTNAGTAPSWPQFEVTGLVDASGFEIVTVDTGTRLVFEGAVPAGSALVLDSATGSVVIDGDADRGALLTTREWEPVPAGGSATFAFVARGSAGDGSLRVSLRPAFW